MDVIYEWNNDKAVQNLQKHRVSFETAARVFSDPFALIEHDRFEYGEMRWRTMGFVEGYLLLVVAHTVRDDDGAEVIRIISARRADAKERKRYAEENR